MNNRYSLAILSFVLFLAARQASAQAVGDNVFLKGKYVEIGIAPNGGYGSTLPAPTGYHPNLSIASFTFWDPAGASATSGSNFLGFVADYGADGWTVGTPPYYGDFYLPGTPQEGWAIKVGTGLQGTAYIPSFQYFSGPALTGYTGGLAGTNVGYSSVAGVSKGVWQGTKGALAIRQTTTLDTNKLYFTVNVVLINTGTTTLPDIYYLRTVDPDNEQTQTGSYNTINTITYQLPNPENRVLVSATGVTHTDAYMGLGTKDCRAKCVIFNGGSLTPSVSPDSLFNQLGVGSYFYTQGQTANDDKGIGLVFNIGAIAAGDSTTLSYAYILNASYIDSALNSTQPQFTVNGASFDSATTINFCTYTDPGININMVNGGFYHWTYSPDLYLSTPTGISTTIDVHSITSDITYTITGTNASGGCDSVKYYLTIKRDTFPGPTTSPETYCQGAPASPLTATGTNINWRTVPSGGISTHIPPTPPTTVAGTLTYYVSDSIGTCESEISPLQVIIKPMPLPPSITGITPYCFAQTFVPLTVSGTGILWYTSLTGGFGDPTAPFINTSAPGTYVNYASQQLDGCESSRSGFTTTVLPHTLPVFTYEKHYGCHGDTVRFINTSLNSTRYFWAFGDGTSDTTPNAVHIYLTQGIYTVKLNAISGGGCTDSMLQTIDLLHPLHAAFTATPAIVCQQLPVTFTNTSTGTDTSFRWYFGNGATDTATNPVYIYNNSGTYTATLIVKDFVPCYDTVTQMISVDTTSGIRLDITDSVLCAGTNITLQGQYASLGNTGITWVFGDGTSIENVNPVYHAYAAGIRYTVTATAHYRACRDTFASRTVTVLPQPSIDLGRDTSICPGSEAIVIGDIANKDNSLATYVWSNGVQGNTIAVVAPGTYYATVNINNCYASDTVLVSNDCYMSLPNVFTPNGDGVNDYFFPRKFLTKGLTKFSMNIYNRWGQLIFETTSLDGSGWDGKLNNIEQPVGVYVYIIDAAFRDGQSEHHQGNVTLLR